MFPENLMRDAGICPSGNLHSLQIAGASESLGRRQHNGPLPGCPRADEGAVNIPKEQTLLCLCNFESFGFAQDMLLSRTRNVVEESVDSCKFAGSDGFFVLRLRSAALI